jgi:uncharacterized protein YkwD
MLTALTLCASLLIPATAPENTAEKTPVASSTAKAENSKPEEKNAENKKDEKTDEKAGEKTAKENTKKTDDKDQTAEKSTEQTTEKTADEKQEEKTKEDSEQDKKGPQADSEKSGEKTAESKKKDEELLAIEANIIAYTNQERARYGLRPLRVDMNLMKTAREHGSWMAWNRIFQHTRRPVAENIAMGQPSSQDVVRSWMNSSGHRANILNPNHNHIGVGAYRTEGGTIYWVQQFSR